MKNSLSQFLFGIVAVVGVLSSNGVLAEKKVVEKAAIKRVAEKAVEGTGGATGGKAVEKTGVKKMRTGIVFETQAVDPEVFTRVKGAKESVMVPAYEWDYGVRLFTAEKWRERGFGKGEFERLAEELADEVMDGVTPEFVRDAHDVVVYAVIRGEDPFLSSILLSENFLPTFKKTMGETVRVVILDRQVIYVFPGLGGKLDGYGSALAEEYQATRQPVSLEIFQVSNKGFKVIGTIER